MRSNTVVQGLKRQGVASTLDPDHGQAFPYMLLACYPYGLDILA